MQKISRLSPKDLELIEMAKTHAKKCYRDGITSMATVLRTKSGSTYTGINVKYKKVWKCICAERVSIAKAIEAGESEFDTIVTVKYSHEENDYVVMNMCGECRQIAVFYPTLQVICGKNGEAVSVSVEKVFPYPYS